jgi:hypothetical protein
MSKKFKKGIVICGGIVLIGVLFINLVIKDDYQIIEKKVEAYYMLSPNIAHIEIDGQYALAFYERGDSHMGVMELKKTWVGWHLLSSVSDRVDEREQFIALSHFSIIQQRACFEVEMVMVELQNGETQSAPIIRGENAYRSWYYYSDTEDLAGAVVTTYDQEGQQLNKIKIPNEPNVASDRTVN